MGARSKYKQLSDLYVIGRELVFKDGTVMWVQVLNDFERAECRRAAGAQRAKLVLALREMDSAETANVRGAFYSQTAALTIDELIQNRSGEWYMKIVESVANDPDWRERVEISDRAASGATTSVPNTPEEEALLTKINEEWLAEVNTRLEAESAAYREDLEAMDEARLFTEYENRWSERAGSSAALGEFNLYEIFNATRCCEAVKPDEGNEFDHTNCNHRLHAYETVAEVRDLPDGMKTEVRDVLDELAMSERDARFSDRSLSSSSPSQGPGPEADSTLSTPIETEEALPGT